MSPFSTADRFSPPTPPPIAALPAPLPPQATTSERVNWCFDAVGGVLGPRIPLQALLPGERAVLGGWLYPGDAAVVRATGEALDRCPQHYPDIPFSGADLIEDVREGNAWFNMAAYFTAMGRLCQDAYVDAMARGVKRAHAVIDQVFAAARIPLVSPQLDHRRRTWELHAAWELRRSRRASSTTRRAQRRAEPSDPQAPTPQEQKERAAAARKHKQQESAAIARRAKAQAALYEARITAQLPDPPPPAPPAPPTPPAPPAPAAPPAHAAETPPAAAQPVQDLHTMANFVHCTNVSRKKAPLSLEKAVDRPRCPLASLVSPRNTGETAAWAPLTTSSSNMIPIRALPSRWTRTPPRWRSWRPPPTRP